MCQIQFIKPYKMVNGEMQEDILDLDDKEMFSHLMKLGTVSNPNAWGYFTTNTSERFPDGFNEKHLRNIIGKTFIVGHNRFATKGSKKKNRNNHPFKSTRFTWVHNGIIDNDDEIRKKFNFQTKGEVDSAIIGQLVEKHLSEDITVGKAIANAMEEVDGDYSIFIQDRKTDKLYYFRNLLRHFSVRLYKKRIDRKTDRYIMVGSTDKDNMTSLYKSEILGLPINDYSIKSTVSINPNIIFEIGNNGFIPLENFTPKVRETYATVYDGTSEYDDACYNATDSYDEDLTFDEVMTLEKLLNDSGLDVTIIQNMSDASNDITDIKIVGKELDFLIDTYPEAFMEETYGVLKPEQVRLLINMLQDELWEQAASKDQVYIE